jgi:phosphate:Na+ symporter
MDLVASMIEEADFTGSLNESLYQIARRIERDQFSPASREVLDLGLDHLDRKLTLLETTGAADLTKKTPEPVLEAAQFEAMRWTVIDATDIPAAEKGALLALLGSMERAEALIDRIEQERASVDRDQASILAEA